MSTLSSEPQAPSGATPKERRWYITYGQGSNLQNCYSEFYADSHEEAGKIAYAGTGGKHAFMYSRENWEDNGITQAERYGLREVPLQPQKRISKYNEGYL
jgi:hypothetical protein